MSQELTAPTKAASDADAKNAITAEQLFLDAAKEFDGNLGFLMIDRFASHTLRVLLLVLSGRPLADVQTTSLLQSKRKENITLASRAAPTSSASSKPRTVPDSFQAALEDMMKSMVAGLDSTYLRALAPHPVANPLLQLVLELEFSQFGKSKTKDPNSLFKKLLPDDPLEQGTDSASFFNGMLYDPIGSRLLEVLVRNSPGKTFRALYRNLVRDRLPDLAKNETASYVLIKTLERLNKEDLEEALQQLCPQVQILVDRSRTSVIKCLVDRCRIRAVDTIPLYEALDPTSGKEPDETLRKLLKLNTIGGEGMSEERQQRIENQEPSKAHASLLAQSILEVDGRLQSLVVSGISFMDRANLLQMAKDRSATHVLQKYLTCSRIPVKTRRLTMHHLTDMVVDLATDPAASHVLDAFWAGSNPEIEGMKLFIREALADRLLENEAILRDSVSGRAVWRTWKMDMYKTRRYDWRTEAKKQESASKRGLSRQENATLQKSNVLQATRKEGNTQQRPSPSGQEPTPKPLWQQLETRAARAGLALAAATYRTLCNDDLHDLTMTTDYIMSQFTTSFSFL